MRVANLEFPTDKDRVGTDILLVREIGGKGVESLREAFVASRPFRWLHRLLAERSGNEGIVEDRIGVGTPEFGAVTWTRVIRQFRFPPRVVQNSGR